MQLRGLDTNLIVALRALLVEQNVTRAAREVGLSQSSMSHALARLRLHFGDQLLVPRGRALALTELAQSLREPVEEAVILLERVFTRAQPFEPKTSRRTFRLASTDNVDLYVLPALAEALRDEAPGVNLHICALPENWIAALQRGDIDLKLGRKYPIPESLKSEVLSHESLVCVVRKGHPLARKPTLEAFAALDHLIVTPSARAIVDPAGPLDDALAKQGLRRRIALAVPHFLPAPFIVARSDLALTAPARLLEPLIPLLGLRRVTLPIELPSYELSQVWSPRTHADEGHAWLRTRIAKILQC